mmetsp:Transcript_31118/g.107016  ORF Transcript_31118/g.107016 Transcript_31118/m.107016 type:complete len:273 (-) Transcript_31118:119-937(-)
MGRFGPGAASGRAECLCDGRTASKQKCRREQPFLCLCRVGRLEVRRFNFIPRPQVPVRRPRKVVGHGRNARGVGPRKRGGGGGARVPFDRRERADAEHRQRPLGEARRRQARALGVDVAPGRRGVRWQEAQLRLGRLGLAEPRLERVRVRGPVERVVIFVVGVDVLRVVGRHGALRGVDGAEPVFVVGKGSDGADDGIGSRVEVLLKLLEQDFDGLGFRVVAEPQAREADLVGRAVRARRLDRAHEQPPVFGRPHARAVQRRPELLLRACGV